MWFQYVTSLVMLMGLALLLVTAGCATGDETGDAVNDAHPSSLQSDRTPHDDFTFETYRNARFDYEISYPANLVVPLGEPDGRRGQSFASSDGSLLIDVYGWHNADGKMIEEVYDLRVEETCTENRILEEERIMDDAFFLTCSTQDYISYEQTQLRGDILVTLRMEVDREREEEMKPVVAQVMASLNGFPTGAALGVEGS